MDNENGAKAPAAAPAAPATPATPSGLDALPARVSEALEAQLGHLPAAQRNGIVSTVDTVLRAEIALAKAKP